MSVTLRATSGVAPRSHGRRVRGPRAALAPWTELQRRQPHLAAAAMISLLAVGPCLVAMLIDARTVNDVNVWIKPTKFLISFAVYYATLAWAFGYLPRTAQTSRPGRFVIGGAIVVGLLEMTWLILAAANGVPAHFNSSSPVWGAAYTLAGAGSLVLISAILVQGVMIARQRAVPVAPTLRWALVAGAGIAFGATLVTAGYLSMGTGHWVGGEASDAGGLALTGWSRTGGDLRVAHFWALHAQQIVPGIGWLLAVSGLPRARGAVLVAAAGYVALIAFTFVQALHGEPFLGSIR